MALVPVNKQVILQLDSAAYDAFTGGAISIPITEREGAIISTMLNLIMDRTAWQEMTDLEWETRLDELEALNRKLSP